MKKVLSGVFSLALFTFFFACQKSQEVALPNTQDEILSCGGGGGTQEPPPTLECGVFRTQSQGGWGAYPSGMNAGKYLHANFAAAFPSGLKIGCDDPGHSIYFTSAGAITKFLPSSGYPSGLAMNATDPQYGSIRNTLIGQVTALSLNVGFDFYDPNFSPAEEKLGNLNILSGPFAGHSVNDFLSISNAVIGGCNVDYTAESINQTASAINANFLDGRTNGGLLGCPTTRFAER